MVFTVKDQGLRRKTPGIGGSGALIALELRCSLAFREKAPILAEHSKDLIDAKVMLRLLRLFLLRLQYLTFVRFTRDECWGLFSSLCKFQFNISYGRWASQIEVPLHIR
jgi:hypothetical protein